MSIILVVDLKCYLKNIIRVIYCYHQHQLFFYRFGRYNVALPSTGRSLVVVLARQPASIAAMASIALHPLAWEVKFVPLNHMSTFGYKTHN